MGYWPLGSRCIFLIIQMVAVPWPWPSFSWEFVRASKKCTGFLMFLSHIFFAFSMTTNQRNSNSAFTLKSIPGFWNPGWRKTGVFWKGRRGQEWLSPDFMHLWDLLVLVFHVTLPNFLGSAWKNHIKNCKPSQLQKDYSPKMIQTLFFHMVKRCAKPEKSNMVKTDKPPDEIEPRKKETSHLSMLLIV